MGKALADLDSDRAELLIQTAQDLAEDVITPLPASASGIVLQAAARAYSNPTGTPTQAVGPFSVAGSSGGVYLTKQDRAALRRAGGISGAFSIDTLPTGTAEVRTVTVAGVPTGGTFTLRVPWGITVPIAYNATAEIMQAALSSIPNLAGVAVAGPVNGTYTVTLPILLGPSTGQIVPTSSLTGGTQPTVVTGITTVGVYPPGAGLAAWDYSNTSSWCWQ